MDIYPHLVSNLSYLYIYSTRLTFITALILIISVYKTRFHKKEQLSNYFLLLVVFFISIFWFLTSWGIIKSSIYPERLLNFAWSILLIYIGNKLNKNLFPDNNSWEKAISIIFIIAFITMNISLLAMNTSSYDPSVEPNYISGATSLIHSPQEYAAFSWFNGSGVVQGDRTTEDFLIHKNLKVRTDPEFFLGNLSMIKNSNWLIIREEMYNRIAGTRIDNLAIKKPLNLSYTVYTLIDSSTGFEKIYNNNQVLIYNVSYEDSYSPSFLVRY